MRRPAGGHVESAPKGHRWRRRARLDWRKPVHVTLKFRGGPEAWVEVHARGDFARYPGWVALVDVLSDITAQ